MAALSAKIVCPALRGKAHDFVLELEDELACQLELAGRTDVADREAHRSDYAEGGGSEYRDDSYGMSS
jgi:hypothetical protein